MNEEQSFPKLPLSPSLVKSIVGNFCQSPLKGDDGWAECSIGVAGESIAATDTMSAIIIGEPTDRYEATSRKELMIELERAHQYGDVVHYQDVERQEDGGQPRLLIDAPKLVASKIRGMKLVAGFNPSALAKVASAAAAAGARTVHLLQPEDGAPIIGFTFEFEPDSRYTSLFSDYPESIGVAGIIVADRDKSGQRTLPDDEIEAGNEGSKVEVGPKTKKGGKKAKKIEIEVSSEEATVQLKVVEPDGDYRPNALLMPSLGCLSDVPVVPREFEDQGKQIIDVLRDQQISARMTGYLDGASFTQYQIQIPPTVKASKVEGASVNLQLALEATSIRIVNPIPGKNAIGIEVPNKNRRVVSLKSLVSKRAFGEGKILTVALGEDVEGKPIYCKLDEAPHILIAGTTGSGKSIVLASMLSSIALKEDPSDVRLVLIDPKQVELGLFEGLPHLMCPVITDVHEVPGVLSQLVGLMEERYARLKEDGVRNIDSYNEKYPRSRMSKIVVVVDELADLMMQVKDPCEDLIVRLAQKARAVGIHLVLATQRPSVDVVTGLIKANVPSRIALTVSSQIDSRVVLDCNGAETLIGKGDLMYAPVGSQKPQRLQGAYVSEEEVENIVRFWKQNPPAYELEMLLSAEEEVAE